MRIDIKGNNPITCEQFKSVIDQLNEDFGKIGLTVKNMTCYVRFENEKGEVVEPTMDGAPIRRSVSSTKEAEVAK